MEKSKAALSKEMLRVQSFDIKGGPESSAVVEFPRATQDPEIEALLDMANMMAIAQGSPFPTLAQWLALLKPRHARAHWHRRVLLRRQTEKSLQRLASTGDESVPESALGQLLRREKRAAAKMGRPPDFWSHAIRDEVRLCAGLEQYFLSALLKPCPRFSAIFSAATRRRPRHWLGL